ncbi:zinc metalloproteinase dpy-31 [Lingula anatina]|uniref:Zinc metalloproteinase dpy-31 n=1 Tax=Lingula anatina TaxID=7574 RepID=A0A1S3IL11_LINAN|nr:zinc metalloproteinase dpy-31 [Lingula anatina]|eukprot:XP_013398209.1 zinc metalloproteinase dpy-31 [Lingula anatina]
MSRCSSCLCPEGLSGIRCDRVMSSKGQHCGAVLEATEYEQTIESPGYDVAMRFGNRYRDTPYARGQQCSWLIKAPPGHVISLYFKGPIFNIAAFADGLCNDYVEIRYGKSIGTSGARFCGSEIPTKTITTLGNAATVLFRASEREWPIDRVGFKLAYKIHRKSPNQGTFDNFLRNDNLRAFFGVTFDHQVQVIRPLIKPMPNNLLAYFNSLLRR